jgi:myosin heavy subunit
VKSWNDTIEEAIRFKVEYAAIDTKIEDFKKLINNLQDIIITKDKDVQDLTHKLQVYEETNHWFLKWTNVKNFQQFKDFYEEKIFNLQNTILMLLEEKSSMATHLYGKFDEKLLLCLDNEKQLMKKISLLQEQIQQEISMREKLSAEYQQLVLENLSLKTDKQKAGALENELNAKIETLQSRVSYLESENHQLQDLLNEKDNIFNNYKRQMNAKLEDMEQTISKYESDLDKYEQINFGLKQEIKEKQVNPLNRFEQTKFDLI